MVFPWVRLLVYCSVMMTKDQYIESLRKLNREPVDVAQNRKSGR